MTAKIKAQRSDTDVGEALRKADEEPTLVAGRAAAVHQDRRTSQIAG